LVLPAGTSALPGRVRLFAYQHAIADAFSDPLLERVTLLKSSRVGFSTLLTAAIGSYVVNDPAPILLLLPTQDDCRDVVVSELEPVFAATPVLRGLLSDDTEQGERNTLLSRRFPGGSLKIIASRAPRNLRRHTCRILLIDEADAMSPTVEGDPIQLATRRSLSYPDRKIVLGSTPHLEDTSHVLRSYAASDQRVFECPCPSCGAFAEILWEHIEWEANAPETAAFRCPHCKELISEQHKPRMVEAGRWRATAPEVQGHAGFRINALVSPLANASWGRLAEEYLATKDDPQGRQVFHNTILAQGWRAPGVEIDEASLAARAEDFDLDNIPAEVLLLVAGVDVQQDRLEVTVAGFTKTNGVLILEHGVLWGNPQTEQAPWDELDELVHARFPHPFGTTIRIAATIVDSGFATERVYEFCRPRLRLRCFPGKGLPGSARLPVVISRTKAGQERRVRLALVGVDVIKGQIFSRLEHGRSIRFSKTLEPTYYEQLASERRTITMVHGQPRVRFERKTRHARAETLDCLCYVFASRALIHTSMEQIEQMLRNPARPAPAPAADEQLDNPVAALREQVRDWWRPREPREDWFR
jgi:phage terminase large subunit GpA-like protein